MKTRITRRAINALEIPPQGQQAWLYDSELPGFLVLAQASGRKSYIARYRTPAGAQRKMTLGLCAELLPEDARDMARQVIAAARRGEDPARERSAPTMKDLAAKFMTDHAAGLKPGTRKNYERLWRLHILPRLGALRVRDVKRTDVARLHNSMRATPFNANRALEVVSKAMDLAEIWGLRDEDTNPCRLVRAYGEDHRQRTLTDEELRTLWAVLDREQDAPATLGAAEILKLLLLTGCRKSEWQRARWDMVDLRRGILALPDSKTGRRDVYLPLEAIDILRSLPRSSVYILPGATGGEMTSLDYAWKRIRVEAGLPGVRIHDLRHTVGSAADRAGMSQRQVADLLGHRQTSTTARYINSADEHKRATVDGWGAEIRRIRG